MGRPCQAFSRKITKRTQEPTFLSIPMSLTSGFIICIMFSRLQQQVLQPVMYILHTITAAPPDPARPYPLPESESWSVSASYSASAPDRPAAR